MVQEERERERERERVITGQERLEGNWKGQRGRGIRGGGDGLYAGPIHRTSVLRGTAHPV